MTGYVINTCVYNHYRYSLIIYSLKKKKKHFGSVSNSLDNQIKKGMLMFIIVAAEANGDGGEPLPFSKAKDFA